MDDADTRIDPNVDEDTNTATPAKQVEPAREPVLQRRLRGVEAAAVVFLTVFIASQLSSRNWLTSTTPTGGDIGAHVWFPNRFADLLPGINGWSDDWFSGFPVGLFYFPLPATLTVALDQILSYGAAMKLTVVAGPLLMPYAVWRFTSSFGAGKYTAIAATGAAVTFQFDQFHTIYGGNIVSVLAGMYSYGLGFALMLIAVSCLNRWLDEGRRLGTFVAVAVAAATCHILIAASLALIATLTYLFGGRHKDWRTRTRRFAVAAVGAAGVAAAWWVPVFINLGSTTDMGYETVGNWNDWLAPMRAGEQFTTNTPHHMWVVAVGLVVAAVFALWQYRSARGRVAGVAVTAVVIYAVLYRFVPSGTVWNSRWLPPMYFFAYIAAAVGYASLVGEVVTRIVADRALQRETEGGNELVVDERTATAGRFLGAAAIVAIVAAPAFSATGWYPAAIPAGVTPDSSYVSGWADWNFTGYETKDRWDEYSAIMATMNDLSSRDGCGRALWESNSDIGGYGTPMAMMLLPFWTDGCVDSSEGVYFESSQTTPYHFVAQYAASEAGSPALRGGPYTAGLDLEFAVPAMESLGIRWYMTYTETAAGVARGRDDLTEVAASGPWVVFELDNYRYVYAADHEIVRLDSVVVEDMWDAWAANPTGLVTTAPVDGIESFDTGSAAAAASEPTVGGSVTVSNVDAGDGHVSFDVDVLGEPVVVRQSAFTSWEVEGADGPYPVGPNMMVVYPTSTTVTLHAGAADGTGVGWSITIGTLAVGVGVWLSRRRMLAGSSGSRPDGDRSEVG